MRELEICKGLMVREDGMVKNINPNSTWNAKKDWHTGGGNKGGYCGIKVPGKGSSTTVHRLVAEAFIPNPENKPIVNHINGVKNDNRVSNLEWSTSSENNQHARDTGLNVARKGKDHYMFGRVGKANPMFGKGGKDHHSTKLTVEDCNEIKNHLSESKLSTKQIGELYGVHQKTISNINNGTHWSCK